MKFYNREKEQEELKNVLQQSRKEARMTVLMGLLEPVHEAGHVHELRR